MLNRSAVENFHSIIDNYRMSADDVNQLAFPLLAEAPELVNARLSDFDAAKDEHTPLHRAAVHQNLDLIRRLTALGADVHAEIGAKLVPLCKAITVGLSNSSEYLQTKLKAVELLLEAGTDPNYRSDNEETSLHWAMMRQEDEVYAPIIGLLLQYGADPNAMNSSGWAPLHFRKCSVEALDLMMAHGADINLPNRQNATPLLLSHCDDLAALLKYGADVHARDNYRRSALHYRSVDSVKEDIDLLLQAGAKVDSRDRHGYTPLHYAASACNVDTTRSLIAAGANVNALSHLKETPLSILRSRMRLIYDDPADRLSYQPPAERAAMEALLQGNRTDPA